MGTRAAPTYANIFMSKIDILINKCGIFNTINMIYFYKRFIDDILMIWTGTFDQFLNFMDTINQLHPSIKFTYNFNTESKSTTFLDTEIKIINNKISTDLYKKETDKIQYLLPTSCHPSHVCKNIPYSLALRLVRICSDHQNLLQRLNELKKMLISIQYNENIINSAIQRALSITRQDALKKVVKLLFHTCVMKQKKLKTQK
jgi:peptide-methionine (R)-S-oxide reductase